MPGMIDRLLSMTAKDWEPYLCTCKGMKPHFHIPPYARDPNLRKR